MIGTPIDQVDRTIIIVTQAPRALVERASSLSLPFHHGSHAWSIQVGADRAGDHAAIVFVTATPTAEDQDQNTITKIKSADT